MISLFAVNDEEEVRKDGSSIKRESGERLAREEVPIVGPHTWLFANYISPMTRPRRRAEGARESG